MRLHAPLSAALAAPGQSTASPFAVYDNANINQSAPAGKVLLPKKKEGAAKVRPALEGCRRGQACTCSILRQDGGMGRVLLVRNR